jgi:hypothetical protein
MSSNLNNLDFINYNNTLVFFFFVNNTTLVMVLTEEVLYSWGL